MENVLETRATPEQIMVFLGYSTMTEFRRHWQELTVTDQHYFEIGVGKLSKNNPQPEA